MRKQIIWETLPLFGKQNIASQKKKNCLDPYRKSETSNTYLLSGFLSFESGSFLSLW